MPTISITVTKKDLDDLGDALAESSFGNQDLTRGAKDDLVLSRLEEFIVGTVVGHKWTKAQKDVPKPQGPAPVVTIVP